MNATQFLKALDQLGLSQVASARMLGIDQRQARRYVSGDTEVPQAVAKLLKLALAGKITTDDIADA